MFYVSLFAMTLNVIDIIICIGNVIAIVIFYCDSGIYHHHHYYGSYFYHYRLRIIKKR